MRLGIIGAGRLGSALARRLGGAGHEVVLGSPGEAAAFGEVVALAVPFAAVGPALDQAGLREGTVLWTCVNAIKPDLSGLAVGFESSAAEEVARRAPGACVVSAIPPFAEALDNGDLRYEEDLAPSVFICGDDDRAKAIVELLVLDLGAHPVDAGPLTAARLIEPAMMLMVSIAYAGVPRDVGLRLLERTHHQRSTHVR